MKDICISSLIANLQYSIQIMEILGFHPFLLQKEVEYSAKSFD